MAKLSDKAKKELIDEATGEIPTSKGNPRPFFFNGKNVARKVCHPFANERMAKQEFKKECDINVIMEKYKQTGLLPQNVQNVQGHFANFTTVDDYYTACSKAADAQKAFDLLPSKLRRIFDNDPTKLVEFVSNPKNKLQAARMGLLTKEASKQVYQEAINAKKAAAEKAAEKETAKKPKVQETGQKASE